MKCGMNFKLSSQHVQKQECKVSDHNSNLSNLQNITDYLAKIQQLVESMDEIDSPLAEKDHIYTILDGLPEEYKEFRASVMLLMGKISVVEIESYLAAYEDMINQYKKPTQSIPLANLAQGSASTNQIFKETKISTTIEEEEEVLFRRPEAVEVLRRCFLHFLSPLTAIYA
ncbi:hypothetical protein PIB30_042306 [Stylosanthes scabra]|uniref:Uncharacterized protein n=1 Tax=Stylosanthes scabra TaxID=79078 RepID=A0ABU6YH28_9FABA|nr:hypothetical protein [Stylosanthes scabra]